MDRRAPLALGIAALLMVALAALLLSRSGGRDPADAASQEGSGSLAPSGAIELAGASTPPPAPSVAEAGTREDARRATESGAAQAEVDRPEPSPLELRQALSRVAADFTMPQPDLGRLLHLLDDLSTVSAVDPASVTTDASGEKLSGKLRLEGVEGSADFSIETGGPGPRFHLRIPVPVPGEGYLQSDLTCTFDQGEAGAAILTLRSHPRWDGGAQAEQIIGWSVVLTKDGAEASPLTMRVSEEGGIQVGHSESFERQVWPGLGRPTAFELWIELLAPLAQE